MLNLARPLTISCTLTALTLLAGCAVQTPSRPAPVADLKPGRLVGYLPIAERIDSAAVLPPPPQNTATDEAVSRAAASLRDTPRWKLATRDAYVDFPDAAGVYSCAVGVPINTQDTPYVYQLLRRVASDAGYAGDSAKELYKRNRPFVVNQQAPCTPNEMKRLGADRSYPSGHASTGTAWALLLAELAPDRAVPILKRGQAFAESRVICNMHWQSDTVQGTFVGMYSYNRLQSNPKFQADMRAARKELAAVRAKNLAPNRDCAEEAATLQLVPR